MVTEISCIDAKKALENGAVLLDVREKEEYAASRIEPSMLISLGELQSKIKEIPKNKFILTLCHHGMRSMSAAHFLESNGFQAASVRGGIEEWSKKIDQKIPKYTKRIIGNKIEILLFEKKT